MFYPKRGQGVVVMANGDQGDALAREVLRSVSREYGWVPGLVMEAWMVALVVLIVIGVIVVTRYVSRLRRIRTDPAT